MRGARGHIILPIYYEALGHDGAYGEARERKRKLLGTRLTDVCSVYGTELNPKTYAQIVTDIQRRPMVNIPCRRPFCEYVRHLTMKTCCMGCSRNERAHTPDCTRFVYSSPLQSSASSNEFSDDGSSSDSSRESPAPKRRRTMPQLGEVVTNKPGPSDSKKYQ